MGAVWVVGGCCLDNGWGYFGGDGWDGSGGFLGGVFRVVWVMFSGSLGGVLGQF